MKKDFILKTKSVTVEQYLDRLETILNNYASTTIGDVKEDGSFEFYAIPNQNNGFFNTDDTNKGILIRYNPNEAKEGLALVKALKEVDYSEPPKAYLCWDNDNTVLGIATSEKNAQKMCSKTGQSYMPVELNQAETDYVETTALCTYNIWGKFYPYEVAKAIPGVSFKGFM